MILISIMNAKVLTIQLLPQQFLFLHLHSHIPPLPPKKTLAQNQKNTNTWGGNKTFKLQEIKDLRSIHLSFHGMHEKESYTTNWIDKDSSSVENNSCMLLDNSGQRCAYHIHLKTKTLLFFRQLKTLNILNGSLSTPSCIYIVIHKNVQRKSDIKINLKVQQTELDVKKGSRDSTSILYTL